MVILRNQNKITDFLTILAWLSPFKYKMSLVFLYNSYYYKYTAKMLTIIWFIVVT